jgi:SAM-dependent methyltransferase
MGASEPWFVDAFRDDYVDVYPHRDLESARREARWLIDQGLTGRVLDLCCGFGRHTLALRERGLDVFGMDLSMDLLRRARDLPGSSTIRGRLARADVRRVPFASASFDGVVLLFSSFGYFGEEGDARVLDEITRVLAARGVAILDLMNPSRIRAALVPHSRTDRGAYVLDEHRRLEDAGRRVVKDVVLEKADGSVRRWSESVRMYEMEELEVLLAARALEIESIAGDFDSTPPGPTAPRQIVRVRKLSGRSAQFL